MAKAKKARKAAKPKAKKAVKRRPKPTPKPVTPAAPAAPAPAAPVPEVKKELVGTVEHYYGGIGVAVVKAVAPLRVGDEILIERGEGLSFRQKVESMEIEHQKVSEVKPGDSFGLKTVQKAAEGNKVYKIVG